MGVALITFRFYGFYPIRIDKPSVGPCRLVWLVRDIGIQIIKNRLDFVEKDHVLNKEQQEKINKEVLAAIKYLIEKVDPNTMIL